MYKEYRVISHVNYQQFDELVQDGLKIGFSLIGGVSVVLATVNNFGHVDPNGRAAFVYFQAIAR